MTSQIETRCVSFQRSFNSFTFVTFKYPWQQKPVQLIINTPKLYVDHIFVGLRSVLKELEPTSHVTVSRFGTSIADTERNSAFSTV